MRALSVGLLVRSIALIASLFVFVPLSFAQSTTGHPDSWSGQDSSLPGVKGGYHIVTTDPNRRDDQIGSSDDNTFKLGQWEVRTWGDISFGIGASSGNRKSGH
ncbi:MAG: hypothetical protein ACTHJV_17280 [Rhizobiaceae bacterium]